VTSAGRSRTKFCLAALEQRERIMQGQNICMLWICVVYKSLDVRGRLAGVFLELCLGIEGKHVAFLELWLVMASL